MQAYHPIVFSLLDEHGSQVRCYQHDSSLFQSECQISKGTSLRPYTRLLVKRIPLVRTGKHLVRRWRTARFLFTAAEESRASVALGSSAKKEALPDRRSAE